MNMPNKRSSKLTNHSKQVRSRTKSRDRVPTPWDRLKAVVTVIGDEANTKPSNCLIGSTPFETINTCNRIIKGLVASRHGDTGVVIANADVLNSVFQALEHAKDGADMLWKSAEAVAKAPA
jgi:hypothetical protein